jgi:predicted CxxxxCH...CXXCH cytochrome family protein
MSITVTKDGFGIPTSPIRPGQTAYVYTPEGCTAVSCHRKGDLAQSSVWFTFVARCFVKRGRQYVLAARHIWPQDYAAGYLQVALADPSKKVVVRNTN